MMAPLGPFRPDRRVAVAVSGGADSLALAILAAAWGRPLALVADHGLRPESAAEAALTMRRLAAHHIPARLLNLRVAPGPGLAARAREARYVALTQACAEAGLPHLLLGHHAGDQAETVLLRALHGSGPAGRAGMATLQSAGGILLLRPLLGVAAAALRQTLEALSLQWIEDPSNQDLRAERARLRAMIGEPTGQGGRTAALCSAAAHWARRRAAIESDCTAWLAAHAVLYPSLHAELPDAPLPAPALSALIRTVTGKHYPPESDALRRLAAAPRPATLGGARLLRGRGRLYLIREAAAAAPPVAAQAGATWDGRFRLESVDAMAAAPMVGALGADAAAFRRVTDLPAAVLASLPCVRDDGSVIAIPHLRYGSGAQNGSAWNLLPAVNQPATRGGVNWPVPN